MTKLTYALVVGVAMLASVPANATTWSFGGNGGDLGLTENFISDGWTLAAKALDLTSGTPAPFLYQTSSGLGVTRISGDSNTQIDNEGHVEAIVFDLGSLASLTAINLQDIGSDDDYRIYGSNNAAVLGCTGSGLSCITSISTLLLSDDNSGSQSITGAYRYVIATLTDQSSNDDYSVYALSANRVSETPLPAALPLFVSGLGVVGLVARRRKRTAAATV